MELNPGGVIAAVLIVVVIAIAICVAILALLDKFKVIRFHEKSGIFFYGIIAGIALAFIFITKDFNCSRKEEKGISDPAQVK